MWLSDRELRKHKRKLYEIERAGEKKLMKDELKQKKEEYWPKKKIQTSKVALWYIFISCTAVQIYSMVAMWHFMDLSALGGLIASVVGEATSFWVYSAKSGKENSKGGIVYEMAMKAQEEAQTSSEDGLEEIEG